MNKTIIRRGLSFALALVLALSAFPAAARAAETDGLCDHHPAHTDDCGYAEAGICQHVCSGDNGCITVQCAHEHVATCFDAQGNSLCRHACTDNEACYTPVTNCLHTAHGGCGHHEGEDCDFAVNGCAECEKENALTQIKGTDVTIEGYSFVYTGEEIRPTVTVKVGDAVLTEGKHYSVSYENNIGVGTASVTVTGIEEGGFSGIVTIPFTIERKPGTPEYTMVEIKGTDVTINGTSFVYTGEAIEPGITVTVDGKVLTAGKDYTVSYENNIQPGTATVTVRGIATASETLGYTGEVKIDFTITPAPQQPEESEPEESKPEESKPEDTKPEETEPVTYKITKGNGKTWYQNSGKTLSFTINGDAEDFTGISIKGKKLDKSDFTVTGDTVVTLKTSYLNKLTVGKYDITFHFEDGKAEGSFRVSDKYDDTNPTTGDTIGMWAGVMLASLAALSGVYFVYRKRIVK